MMSFLKSTYAPWASVCWLLWYCYIVLSCFGSNWLHISGATALSKRKKPNHIVGVLNNTNEIRIVMHHADRLLSKAVEETWRIDTALVSRKVAFFKVFSFWVLFRITYWTAHLPVQLAARILDKWQIIHRHVTCRDRLVRVCSAAHGIVQIRLSDIALFIHNPHGVVLWASVDGFARILRLQVRAGRATTFSAFFIHPVSLRIVHIYRGTFSGIGLPSSIPPPEWLSHKTYSSWRR